MDNNLSRTLPILEYLMVGTDCDYHFRTETSSETRKQIGPSEPLSETGD
jgi:hypothetical protein